MASCGGCGGCASGGCASGGCSAGCGGCGSGDMYLSELEITILTRFAETPFYPVGHDMALTRPVCLEWDEPEGDVSDALEALQRKGLIEIDADEPLRGFSYGGYEKFQRHGSMALTARGQLVLDLMDIQGIGE